MPWIALFSAFLIAGPPLARFEYFRILMGTKIRMVLYAHDESTARSAAAEAFDRIRAIEEVLTDYDPESELMGLRQGRQAVGPDLYRILEKSQWLSRQTAGAFDVTVGPLVRLWREARRSGTLPDPLLLKAARRKVGRTKLTLSEGHVTLHRDGMQLDVGGIGKGYAADEALEVLRLRGIESALVDAGGDIGLGAAPPGQNGWRIERLDAEAPLILQNCGVSTSGDLEQFIDIDGIRYSHIVDPRTGQAVRHTALVTVVARDAATADAVATALNVLSPDEGTRLLASHPEWKAYRKYRKVEP